EILYCFLINLKRMRTLFFGLLCFLAACNSTPSKESKQTSYKTTGSVEKLDAGLDSVIAANAKIEIIGEGFEWSEGPLLVEKHKLLLFSDVPRDKIYKWTEDKGVEVYLTPSGYTDSIPRDGEMGSNGLLLDNEG